MVDAFTVGSPFAARSADRRLTSRFPLRQEVRYRLVQSKAMSAKGVGQTLDISSGGVLFTTSERLPTGRMVEIAMNWPARLNGTCALQFVARGRVIRADSKTAVVRIQRYEFRTRGAASPLGS
jgi:hypothetical protein